MARVRKVVLVEAPPGPDAMFGDPKMGLALNPDQVAVYAVSLHENSVRDAAYRINSGQNAELPPEEYYAIWRYNPDADDVVKVREEDRVRQVGGEEPGRWELLIGITDREPEAWVETVNSLRRRKKTPFGRVDKRTLFPIEEVRLIDPPSGPNEYVSPAQALAANPDKQVVDAVFATKTQVYNAAYRVNDGERKDWPKEKYFAIFGLNPEPGEPDENGVVKDAWQLLIGVRPHIPEGWKDFVSIPGSRRDRRNRDEQDVNQQESDHGAGETGSGDSDDRYGEGGYQEGGGHEGTAAA